MHLAEFPVAQEQSLMWNVKDIDYRSPDTQGHLETVINVTDMNSSSHTDKRHDIVQVTHTVGLQNCYREMYHGILGGNF